MHCALVSISFIQFTGHSSFHQNWLAMDLQGVTNSLATSGKPGTACDFAVARDMALPTQGSVLGSGATSASAIACQAATNVHCICCWIQFQLQTMQRRQTDSNSNIALCSHSQMR